MKHRFLLVVLVTGLCGLWLLSLRQQRIVLIHEMCALHHQLASDKATLWTARAEVAAMTAPSAVDEASGPDWTFATHRDDEGGQ
jgi:hypothetical protein